MAHEVRRRRRPAKACVECRRRKVKCDLKSPCGPCDATRAECIYRGPDRVPGQTNGGRIVTGRRDIEIAPYTPITPAVNGSTTAEGEMSTSSTHQNEELSRHSKSPARAESIGRGHGQTNSGHGTYTEHTHPKLSHRGPRSGLLPRSHVAIPSPAAGSDSTHDSTASKSTVYLKKTRVLRWSDEMGSDLVGFNLSHQTMVNQCC